VKLQRILFAPKVKYLVKCRRNTMKIAIVTMTGAPYRVTGIDRGTVYLH
jgi:hypothetical protein